MNEWRETYRGIVFPAQCDHLGHMSARFYSDPFDDAAFQIWPVIGWPHERNHEHGAGTVAARYRFRYLQEAPAGTLYVIRSAVTRLGNKSVTHSHRMENTANGDLLATMDCVEVFFDEQARTSAPMPAAVRRHLESVLVEPADDAPVEPAPHAPSPPGPLSAWFETHRSVVFPWRCDHLGHMNARWYLHHYDDAGFHLLSRLGHSTVALNRRRCEPVVAEYVVNFVKEMLPGQLIRVESGISRVGSKSFATAHRMYDADSGVLHGACESVGVCFDDVERKTVVIPHDLREAMLERVVDPG